MSYLAIDFNLFHSMTGVYFTPAKYAQFNPVKHKQTQDN